MGRDDEEGEGGGTGVERKEELERWRCERRGLLAEQGVGVVIRWGMEGGEGVSLRYQQRG